MKERRKQLEAELERIAHGPPPKAKPGGIGTVRFTVRCPLGSDDVLTKAKSVLRCVDKAALENWPSEEEWAEILPDWFVAACAPEMSRAQAEEWLASWKRLSKDEQARVELEKDWSLADWLYWMEPANREWFWWDTKSADDVDHILVAIEVDGWPFPWGALRWLFKACGASAVDPEE